MIFKDIPIVSDDRVSPVLEKCLSCDEPFEHQTTDDSEDVMMLFAQCKQCGRAYILDSMTLPTSPRFR